MKHEIKIKGGQCKSAQFRTSSDLTIGDTVGKCALSKFERGLRPQAYRASWYRDEYLQSQCHKICKYICLIGFFCYFLYSNLARLVCFKTFLFTAKDEYCSYAEYRNVSLPLSDLKIPDLNMKQVRSYKFILTSKLFLKV